MIDDYHGRDNGREDSDSEEPETAEPESVEVLYISPNPSQQNVNGDGDDDDDNDENDGDGDDDDDVENVASNVLQHTQICENVVPNPRKLMRALFHLDPSNQSCADCQVSLSLEDEGYNDQVYVSFQSCKENGNSVSSVANATEFWSALRQQTFAVKHSQFTPYMYSFPGISFCVFVCSTCAQAHKSVFLKRPFSSHVKCLNDVKDLWTPNEVAFVKQNHKGNGYANSVLERYMPTEFKNRFSLIRHGHKEMEHEVMVRAKYQALAFIFPYGPLNEYQLSKNTSNLRKDRWLIQAGSKQKLKRTRSQRFFQQQQLPSRVVDFFCVVGWNNKTKSNPEMLSSWTQLELIPEIKDCYPPSHVNIRDEKSGKEKQKDFYDDTSFPMHIAHMMFPDGYRLVKHPKQQPKPSCFTFVLTLESGLRLYGCALHIYDAIFDPKKFLEQQEDRSNFMKINKDDEPLYIPKALIVFSHYPFYDTFSKFLTQLYRISRTPASLPLERYIANFMREVPLPPYGKIEIRLQWSDDLAPMVIQRPPRNRLPLVGVSYRPLFGLLSVGNILTIFGCLLQECRLVFCSEHYALLTPVCEALLSLLYPLVWQGCYIPVLPYNNQMLDILEAPFPFVIGLHSRFLEERTKPHGVIFVDLDNDVVHLGYEEVDPGAFMINNKKRSMPCLPEKNASKLRSALEQIVGSHLYVPPVSHTHGQITHGDGEVLRNENREYYAYVAPNNGLRSHIVRTGTPPRNLQPLEGNIAAPAPTKTTDRNATFKDIDLAFPANEHMIPVANFITESGALISTSDQDDEKKSIANPNKLAKGMSIGKGITTKMKRTIKESTSRKDLLDRSSDESEHFSGEGVRNAFLRFFVTIFLNYEKHIITGDSANESHDRFNETAFLQEITSSKTRGFMSTLLASQMFERFLEERLSSDPPPDEVRFFNESICAKRNRSKTKKWKKIATPFLDDQSGKITDVFHPPPPSNWGLPDDGTSYRYHEFPKLNSQLFGTIRLPKQWKEKRMERMRSVLVPNAFMSHPKTLKMLLGSDETLPSFEPDKKPLQKTSSKRPSPKSKWAVRVPDIDQRDAEWAIHLLAYRYITSVSFTRTTAATKHHVHLQEEEEEAITASPNMVKSAESLLLSVCQKQRFVLYWVIRLQAWLRMVHKQLWYARLLKSTVWVQRHHRKCLLVRQHGHILRYYLGNARNVQSIWRGYRVRVDYHKTRKALLVVQRHIRGWCTRQHQKLMVATVIKLQSMVRARRARFAFDMLRQMVVRVQALARGFLDRITITKFKARRIKQYRTQMVHLWQQSYVSFEYRSKFWTAIDGMGFMNLGLHEDELKRLWKLLGLLDISQNLMSPNSSHNGGGGGGGALKEVASSSLYQNFLKVEAELKLCHNRNHHNEGNDFGCGKSDSSVSSTTSSKVDTKTFFNVINGRKKNLDRKDSENVEAVLLQDTFSMDEVVYASSPFNSKLHFGSTDSYNQKLKSFEDSAKMIALERLNIYESLSKCSKSEREAVFEIFAIPTKAKKKKQRVAEMIWGSYEAADASASFILGMNETSRQLGGFGAVPSRKGRQRFGVSSTDWKSPIFNASRNTSHAAFVQDLLERRIKYDLAQTIHAFINSVQHLLMRIDFTSSHNPNYLKQKQARILGCPTSQVSPSHLREKRRVYVKNYLKTFDK